MPVAMRLSGHCCPERSALEAADPFPITLPSSQSRDSINQLTRITNLSAGTARTDRIFYGWKSAFSSRVDHLSRRRSIIASFSRKCRVCTASDTFPRFYLTATMRGDVYTMCTRVVHRAIRARCGSKRNPGGGRREDLRNRFPIRDAHRSTAVCR